MDEMNKAAIIITTVVFFFITLIVGLEAWANYETAKLDYICVPE